MIPMPEYWRQSVYPRLPALIKKFGPTFHLYNKKGIMRTGWAMKSAFAPPLNYRQYFAVKALPEPQIMNFLFREHGFGFDCSSRAELMMARALGAKGDDIIFSSNDTSPAEFAFAAKDGGCMLNLDDISFIPLVPVFPKRIFFRLNPGKRITTAEGNVIGDPYYSKYGITYEQIIPAYRAAILRGATEFGIHIMICSNDLCAKHFVRVTRFVLEVVDMIYRKLGKKVDRIDIGGGFGIPYKPTDRELNLDWIGRKISRLLCDFAAQHGWMPMLMTECGRYLTGPHGILVNPVLHVMQKYRRFIGVEAAMTGCPRPAFYGSYHHIDVLDPQGDLRRGPCHFTNVVGPKCENWDRLTPTPSTKTCSRCGHVERTSGERLLPRSVQRGDILVTGNCGAHAPAMIDNYNGRTRLKGVLDQDGSDAYTVVIRREENIADLFRLMNFPKGTNPDLDCYPPDGI